MSLLSTTLTAIERALQTGETATLTSLIHTLKGTAGSYGFAQITALAAQVEVSLRAGQPDATRTRCAALIRDARRAIGAAAPP